MLCSRDAVALPAGHALGGARPTPSLGVCWAVEALGRAVWAGEDTMLCSCGGPQGCDGQPAAGCCKAAGVAGPVGLWDADGGMLGGVLFRFKLMIAR